MKEVKIARCYDGVNKEEFDFVWNNESYLSMEYDDGYKGILDGMIYDADDACERVEKECLKSNYLIRVIWFYA